jgi:iron-sulfur cluster assembly accessory protein
VKDGARMAVDSASLIFLEGATIDYVQTLVRSGFEVIENPNACMSCSCGASFGVD